MAQQTIGVGTAANDGTGDTLRNAFTKANANFTELYVPQIQSVTSAATVTPTFNNNQVNITAQAAALNIANPTGTAVDGWEWTIRIKDNGTARAITYGANYRSVGPTLPTTTVISKTHYLRGKWNAADSKVDIFLVTQQP